MPGRNLIDILVFQLLAAALLVYVLAVRRQLRRRHLWSGWRTAAFVAGIVAIAASLVPPIAAFAHHDLRGHMAQHLLLGMLAPLALVLAAPVTLLLRTLPRPLARRVIFVLRSRPVAVASHPWTAFCLNIGGMYAIYATPLHAATGSSPWLMHLVHLHFLAAGYLFAWSILAGPDPAPHAPAPRVRLAVLFVAIATHAILGKLMYAQHWPPGSGHSAEEIEVAAQIMYYGGDLAEALLAAALFSRWYRKRGRMMTLPSGTPAPPGVAAAG